MIDAIPMNRLARVPRTLALLGMMLLLVVYGTGCGTRVVNAQKTIVYQGSIYNVSTIRQMRPVRELILPDGSIREYTRISDRELRELFDQHDSVELRLSVLLDDLTLVYLNASARNAREARAYNRRFDNALERIEDFLAHRKKTQLKLS